MWFWNRIKISNWVRSSHKNIWYSLTKFILDKYTDNNNVCSRIFSHIVLFLYKHMFTQVELDSLHHLFNIMAKEKIVEYMLKVQKRPLLRFPRITCKASKKIQTIAYKSKIVFRLYEICGKKVWKMGCNTLASWRINRFLYEWDLFATPMYYEMGQMWRLILHTLFYICCT